jgi:hypothetical protein
MRKEKNARTKPLPFIDPNQLAVVDESAVS